MQNIVQKNSTNLIIIYILQYNEPMYYTLSGRIGKAIASNA